MPDILYSFSASRTKDASKPKTKKTLALDLDETLVHCREYPFENSCIPTKVEIGSQSYPWFIVKRPGIKKFLKIMSKYYILILYTSAVKEYAEAVLKTLKIEHYFSRIYHREHCIQNKDRKFVKNLVVTSVPLSDILLIDDSPVHKANQPMNFLQINPFRGNDPADEGLTNLTDFLVNLSEEQDVRPTLEIFTSKKEFMRTLSREISPKFMDSLTPNIEDEALGEFDFVTLNDEEESYISSLPPINHTNDSKLLLPIGKGMQKIESSTTERSSQKATLPTMDSEFATTTRRNFNLIPVTRKVSNKFSVF